MDYELMNMLNAINANIIQLNMQFEDFFTQYHNYKRKK